MADNRKSYGFTWSTAANGGKSCPAPIEMFVADAFQGQDDGSGFSVDLNANDPVKLVSDGSVALANTTDNVWGIVVGFVRHFDGTRIARDSKLPGGSTGGGLLERQSRILVIPARAGLWAVQVDDKTTATTEAAYQALLGENVNHVCAGVTADLTADPQLDISSHNTTATLDWRLVGIDKNLSNADFSQSNVSLIVESNISTGGGAAATPHVGV